MRFCKTGRGIPINQIVTTILRVGVESGRFNESKGMQVENTK